MSTPIDQAETDLAAAVQAAQLARTTSEAREARRRIGTFLAGQEELRGSPGFHQWLVAVSSRGTISHAGALACMNSWRQGQADQNKPDAA